MSINPQIIKEEQQDHKARYPRGNTWRTCRTHGDEKPNVYGCADCVRELHAEMERLRGENADAARRFTKFRQERDAERNENERLKADLAQLQEAVERVRELKPKLVTQEQNQYQYSFNEGYNAALTAVAKALEG